MKYTALYTSFNIEDIYVICSCSESMMLFGKRGEIYLDENQNICDLIEH